MLLGNAWASIKVLQLILYQHLCRRLLPAWIEPVMCNPDAVNLTLTTSMCCANLTTPSSRVHERGRGPGGTCLTVLG